MIKIIANVNATVEDEQNKGIYIFDPDIRRKDHLTHLLTEINGERTTPLFSKILEFDKNQGPTLMFMTKDRLLYCSFDEVTEKEDTFNVKRLDTLKDCSLDEVVKVLKLVAEDPLSKVIESKEKNLGGSVELCNGNLYWQIHRNRVRGNDGIKLISFDDFLNNRSLLNPRICELAPTIEIKSLDNKLLLACRNSFNYDQNRFQTQSNISSFDSHEDLIAVADYSSHYYILHDHECIAKGELTEHARSVAIGKVKGEYNIVYGHSDGFITIQKFNLEDKAITAEIKVNLYESLRQYLIDNNETVDSSLLENIDKKQRNVENIKITPDGRVFSSLKRFIPYFRLEKANENITKLQDYFLTVHRIQHLDVHYKVE
jgi:hypothetical protein